MANKTALLIIDMQHDFIDKDAPLYVPNIERNLTKLNKFIHLCREKGFLIVYTRHIFSPQLNPIEASLFPGMKFLQEESKGSTIHDSIAPQSTDTVIKKRRYDAFIGTELESLLRTKGVENIIITGTMSNICCESTARTAMMKDFNMLFCSDLTFTHDEKLQKTTLQNISSHFGKVIVSEDIVKLF